MRTRRRRLTMSASSYLRKISLINPYIRFSFRTLFVSSLVTINKLLYMSYNNYKHYKIKYQQEDIRNIKNCVFWSPKGTSTTPAWQVPAIGSS